jgi:hypothetical protein
MSIVAWVVLVVAVIGCAANGTSPTSLVNAWHHFAGAAWMPWVLLAALNTLDDPKPRRVRLWALAQAAQLLAGSAEMATLTLAFTVVAAVATLANVAGGPARLSRLRAAVTALGLAVAMAAALWIPAAELARRSARRDLPEASRTLWSLHPPRLLEVASPVRWHDSGGAPAPLRLPQEPMPPFLSSLYLGVVALTLAAAGLARPGRHRLWLALTAVGAGLVALGPHTPVYGVLVQLVPPLGFFRYPTKAWPAVGLAVALLAGLGLDALRGAADRRERTWRQLLAAAPLLVAGATLWLTLRAGPVGAGATDPRFRAALAASLGVIAYVAVARGGSARLTPFLGLLAVADLAAAHYDLNKTTTAELLAFRPPFVDVLRTPDRSRVYVYDYTGIRDRADLYLGHEPYVLATVLPEGLPRSQVVSQRLYPFPPTAGRWGIEGSFDLDARRLYPDFLSQLVLALRAAEGTPSHLRLLQAGAVSHVAALHRRGLEDLLLEERLPTLFPESLYVFSVPAHLDRAYAVSRARPADDPEALSLLAKGGIDANREVVVEAHASDMSSVTASSAPPVPGGHVQIADFRPDRVTLVAQMPSPGFVVLVDTWDPGWHATVDGQEVLLLRANLAFRAVAVPAGDHRVEMRYRPRSVSVGIILSAVAAALLVGLELRDRRGSADHEGQSVT